MKTLLIIAATLFSLNSFAATEYCENLEFVEKQVEVQYTKCHHADGTTSTQIGMRSLANTQQVEVTAGDSAIQKEIYPTHFTTVVDYSKQPKTVNYAVKVY